MFKWFKKELETITKNYETKENGDIKIKVATMHNPLTYGGYDWEYVTDITIPKLSIVSHTDNSIIFKDYRHYYNFEAYYNYYHWEDKHKSIENKENFIRYKETQLKTYEYIKEDCRWKQTNIEVIKKEIESEAAPLDIFKEKYNSKYKLLETEEEFNEYMASTLDCDTWCRKKLYNKMRELGLGDGFINQFADLVGNNLDKYYAMIDLANEVTDKDTLMYLYTYKFGKCEQE